MSVMVLPHTVDFYAAGKGGGSPTVTRAGVAGYVEHLTADARVRLATVSRSEVARLWLDIAAKGVVLDGSLLFWREQGTWWTVRGTPGIFDGAGAAHIEALIAANVTDGFFASASPVS